jgi:hypothetical protein
MSLPFGKVLIRYEDFLKNEVGYLKDFVHITTQYVKNNVPEKGDEWINLIAAQALYEKYCHCKKVGGKEFEDFKIANKILN